MAKEKRQPSGAQLAAREQLTATGKAAAQHFLPSVRPLFRESELDAPPEQIGSGLLLRIGGVPFLLTAGHVLDMIEGHTLLLASSTGMVRLLEDRFTSEPLSSRREQDAYDIGFLRLTDETVAELDGVRFLTMADVDIRDAASESEFFQFLGWPIRKGKLNVGGRHALLEPLPFSSLGAPLNTYEELGLDPRWNLVMDFRRKRVMTESGIRAVVKPNGISGGAMWRLHSLRHLGARNRVVAIIHEHDARRNLMIGTRIRLHLALIKRTFPEVGRHLNLA
jgi:hypothetical protein